MPNLLLRMPPCHSSQLILLLSEVSVKLSGGSEKQAVHEGVTERGT